MNRRSRLLQLVYGIQCRSADQFSITANILPQLDKPAHTVSIINPGPRFRSDEASNNYIVQYLTTLYS